MRCTIEIAPLDARTGQLIDPGCAASSALERFAAPARAGALARLRLALDEIHARRVADTAADGSAVRVGDESVAHRSFPRPRSPGVGGCATRLFAAEGLRVRLAEPTVPPPPDHPWRRASR